MDTDPVDNTNRSGTMNFVPLVTQKGQQERKLESFRSLQDALRVQRSELQRRCDFMLSRQKSEITRNFEMELTKVNEELKNLKSQHKIEMEMFEHEKKDCEEKWKEKYEKEAVYKKKRNEFNNAIKEKDKLIDQLQKNGYELKQTFEQQQIMQDQHNTKLEKMAQEHETKMQIICNECHEQHAKIIEKVQDDAKVSTQKLSEANTSCQILEERLCAMETSQEQISRDLKNDVVHWMHQQEQQLSFALKKRIFSAFGIYFISHNEHELKKLKTEASEKLRQMSDKWLRFNNITQVIYLKKNDRHIRFLHIENVT
ncbi:hypothetical protein RFI_28511 [Reticulomyxa filosa]|uniref:Uncharacterized protein n=1 Tax=Reticulomyxa filosa TaxID=46433 RepID=X6M5K2_RETFI|nr:hypothetical protein RFI_28511 [Reticulomyxa filosa]|eukprot:ETO08881.1 hypothetical protein RFI_28511 [Reticulomyxa filosa]